MSQRIVVQCWAYLDYFPRPLQNFLALYIDEKKSRLILDNSMWHRIMPLLPAEKGRCVRPSKSNRLMIEAMLWRARTGSPWRDLAKTVGPWESVFTRFSRWCKQGIFQEIFE